LIGHDLRKGKSELLVWSALILIFFGYISSIVRLHPTNFFGVTEDDSIYFSSAKALAEGRGYILPSIPGTPPATKYPILYPLILSAVWKLNPSFPANLPWAIAITVAFGLVYITAGFAFLRNLKILSATEVLLLTAFWALHPLVLFYSANVLSDIPFAALALIGMVLSDPIVDPEVKSRRIVICGIVVGICLLLRMFGVALVAGILTAGMIRRAWRQMFIFTACLSPFFLVILLGRLRSLTIHSPVLGNSAQNLGWIRAWVYYTSYLGMWKLSVPDAHVFWAMISNNLRLLVQGPADLFLSPRLFSDTIVGRIPVVMVAAFMAVGILRQARLVGWKPVHCTMFFYFALIIFWNYPDNSNRFFLPFGFLFAAGLWFELKRLIGLAVKPLFSVGAMSLERCLAAILILFIATPSLASGEHYVFGYRRGIAELSERRALLLKAKRQAYKWLADRGCSPVLAYEDVNVYLYSGNVAIRPVIFITSLIYKPELMDETVSHFMDVGLALNSEYWIFSEDDYSLESNEASAAIWKCTGRLGPDNWPIVFESRGIPVVIRSIRHTTAATGACAQNTR
jgi:hypothetical protein